MHKAIILDTYNTNNRKNKIIEIFHGCSWNVEDLSNNQVSCSDAVLFIAHGTDILTIQYKALPDAFFNYTQGQNKLLIRFKGESNDKAEIIQSNEYRLQWKIGEERLIKNLSYLLEKYDKEKKWDINTINGVNPRNEAANKFLLDFLPLDIDMQTLAILHKQKKTDKIKDFLVKETSQGSTEPSYEAKLKEIQKKIDNSEELKENKTLCRLLNMVEEYTEIVEFFTT